MKNKNVCYTVIVGQYDSLKEPQYISENFDYICFTDQTDFISDVWEIRPLPDSVIDLDNTRKNRYLKWLPHLYLSEYEYSVYVDGSMTCIGDLNELKNINSDKKCMQLLPHNKRTCVYKEFEQCKAFHKDPVELLDEQCNMYKNEGYPKENGILFHCCIVMRYHNDTNCMFIDNKVWDILANKSKRDQLALPYVLWKHNMYDYIYTMQSGQINNFFNYNMSWKHDRKNKKINNTKL